MLRRKLEELPGRQADIHAGVPEAVTKQAGKGMQSLFGTHFQEGNAMIIGEFCDTFPPELDGVGTVVKSYVEELTKLGDDCYFVAPRDPKYNAAALPFKTLLYRGVKMPDEPYHVGLPALDLKYLMEERRLGFDIVHAHSPFTAGMSALHLAGRRKIPIVATFHSKYYDDFYIKTHSELLATLGTDLVVNFYDKCDEVWTLNDKTAEVLRQYGYKKEIFIMPNGTDAWTPRPEEIEAAKRRWGLGEETVLLYVGQMNWKKNLAKTLEATALYAKKHPCRLMMVGQGPDEKEIAQRVQELGIEKNVLFTGHIADRELLMSIFACADLLVFPSKYDNAPMVLREAAAAGTPAILLRGSCASSGIEDGVNGLLCEDTPESIVDCIERGLPERQRIGEKARQTIPEPWKAIVAKARNRYLELIERKKAETGE